MKHLHVAITMDCEPLKTGTHASATGPDTWELGERAVRGFKRIAADFGLPVSYFVHPEAALAQSRLLLELRDQGACLGLHMHPWKYSMSRHDGRRYLDHMGGLDANEQRHLVSEATALWREALGYRPIYFRPGTFSANDSTFPVLAELGFRGGSCSLPGRLMPEMRAVWTGTVPDPHRAHRSFRQVEGDLDFAEMPLSTDFSGSLDGRVGGKLHPDLRPDIDWEEQYGITYRTIAHNIVDQVIERAPAVPVINLVTHNHFDYSNPDAPAARRLRAALEAVHDACADRSIEPVGATMASVADLVLDLPVANAGLVCEGAMYGKQAAPVGRMALA